MAKSLAKFGIDGDMFYLLWGDNLQAGHSFFARTIGEIRKYHLKYTNRQFLIGNDMIDVLAGDDKTPEDFYGWM